MSSISNSSPNSAAALQHIANDERELLEMEEIEQIEQIQQEQHVQQHPHWADSSGGLSSQAQRLKQLAQETALLLKIMSDIAAEEDAKTRKPSGWSVTQEPEPVSKPAPVSTKPTSSNAAYAQGFDIDFSRNHKLTTTINGHSVSTTGSQNQSDLVDFDKTVQGGFRVSTNSNSATVHLDQGVEVTDTYNESGEQIVTLKEGNTRKTLAAGSETILKNGEQIAVNSDGSLSVKAAGNRDGMVETDISNDASGLDVNSCGTNAYFGGYAGEQAIKNHLPQSKPTVA